MPRISAKKARVDILPIDASVVPRYAEIATFLRAPRMDDLDLVDIGVLGVPTDQGLSSRTGTRFGPAAVREKSRYIRRYNPTTHESPFTVMNVADLGDVSVPPYSLTETLQNTEKFIQRLRSAQVAPITVGGDHVLPLAILRGLYSGKPFGILDIDAHPDTNDTFYGNRENHATMFRRLHEEGIIDQSRVVQLGLRGTQFSEDDASYGREVGFDVISFDDYERMGRDQLIKRLRGIFGDAEVYITVDVDGLDPHDAPGTPALEPGGLSARDCQMILRGLRGLNIVGADVCEIAPELDPTGVTPLLGANLVFEFACLIAACYR